MRILSAFIAAIVLVILSGCAASHVGAAFSPVTGTAEINVDFDNTKDVGPIAGERVVRSADSERVVVRAVGDPCGKTRAVVERSVTVHVPTERVMVRATTDSCGNRSVSRAATDRAVLKAVEHNAKVDRDYTDDRSMLSSFKGFFGVHRKYRTVAIN